MRAQCEEAARAGKEQAGAMREMSAATQNTIKQMRLITEANRGHSAGAASVLRLLSDVRDVGDRDVRRQRLAPSARRNGRTRGGR